MKEKLEDLQIRERLLETIKNLSDRDRTLMTLYYYENLTYKEIAQAFNCSVSNVIKVHQKLLNILNDKINNKI